MIIIFLLRQGSPQVRAYAITVGQYYLTHPVKYPGKTQDFRQSIDLLLYFESSITIILGSINA